MQVGLTFDLRSRFLAEGYSFEETAEMDSEQTIDAIANALASLGHHVDRVGHARDLIDKLAAGQRWDMVFNIAEGLKGFGRESQVPAILDLYEIPYTFSDPLTLAVCLHKGMAKMVMRERGIATAPFQVVETLADCNQITCDFPAFVKPIGEGTGKGISPASKVTSRFELHHVCEELLHRFSQPAIIEPFLPGREFTVSILGQGARARVLGTLEICLRADAEPEVYSYSNKERCEEVVEYQLVSAQDPLVASAEATALMAWRALGCRDAGRVDLRCDQQGSPMVMEVNPIPGMHPTHSDLPMTATAIGLTYADLVANIVNEACWRSLPASSYQQFSPPSPHFGVNSNIQRNSTVAADNR